MDVSRNIKLLAWHNFGTDFVLYAPVAILYFTRVSGSYALGMSVFAITQIAQAVTELPTGIFSDMIGRVWTVRLGSLVRVLAQAAYAIGATYWWLVGGALLEGISRAFYSGNNDALLHDTLSQDNRTNQYAEKLGKLSSLFQVALAVAGILGSIIANWSFTWVMWVSVIPQLVCLIISFQLIEPSIISRETNNIYAHFREAWHLFITNTRLRSLTLASTLGDGAGEAIYLFNATFIASLWPVWAIGVAKALSNGGAAISFLTAGKLVKRFQELPLLLWSRVYGRVISVFAYAFPTIASPVLLASHSLLYGTITVADSTLKQKLFSNKQRATMGSLDSLASSLGTAVMTVVVGIFADRWGPIKALLMMQIFQAIPIWIYWRLWKTPLAEAGAAQL